MNPTPALKPFPSKTLTARGTARQLAAASIAENAWRAYAGALRRLEAWLGARPACKNDSPSHSLSLDVCKT